MTYKLDDLIGKITCADCLDVLCDLPDKCLDMILTDPPYGITPCPWDKIIPFEKMWEHFNRIIKDDGAICICATEPFASQLRLSSPNYKYDWIWIKERGTGIGNSHRRPLKQYENICVFYKKQPFYDWRGEELATPYERPIPRVSSLSSGLVSFKMDYDRKTYHCKTKTNIIYANRTIRGNVHPTAKPVDLMQKLIETYTNVGNLVLDCFSGSGTTAVACRNLNRRFICIEKDPEYHAASVKRLEQAKRQQTLF